MKELSSILGTVLKIGVLLFLVMVVYHGFIADPEDSRRSAGDSRLYANLNSSSEARHRAALDQLLARGPAAIGNLRAMAENGDENERDTAFLALQELYHVADPSLAEEIDDCLFALKASDSFDVAKAAQISIYVTDGPRFENVANRLRKLGATVGPIDPSLSATDPVMTPILVEIDAAWTGSEQDFIWLTRLPGLRMVYLGPRVSVRSETRVELHESIPGLRIISTETPCLGFTGHDTVGGFQLENVESGSPADVAGLRPRDRILSINGTPIDGYSELLTALTAAPSGDAVTLSVWRSGAVQQLQATLGHYAYSTEDGVHCQCSDDEDSDEAQ